MINVEKGRGRGVRQTELFRIFECFGKFKHIKNIEVAMYEYISALEDSCI